MTTDTLTRHHRQHQPRTAGTSPSCPDRVTGTVFGFRRHRLASEPLCLLCGEWWQHYLDDLLRQSRAAAGDGDRYTSAKLGLRWAVLSNTGDTGWPSWVCGGHRGPSQPV